MKLSPDQFLKLLQSPSGSLELTRETVVKGNVVLKPDKTLRPPISVIPQCKIEGSLVATGYKHLRGIDCHVTGDVIVGGSGLAELGEHFKADQHFEADGCVNLKSIRGKFGGDVDLRASGVEGIPSSVSISGSLDLRECRHLRSLDCLVAGGVNASKSSIFELGENFRCSGELDLQSCRNIEHLGFVGSPTDVSLEESGIRRIDSSFECTGSLLVANAPRLVSIGEPSTPMTGRSGLSVGQRLVVSACHKLRAIKFCHVGVYAGIFQCPLLEVVSGHVKGSMSVSICGVKKLDNDLNVGGNLMIEKCGHLQGLSPTVGKNLELSELPKLCLLNNGFSCGRDVIVQSCPKLEKLSGKVEGNVLLFGPLNIPLIDKTLCVKGGLRVAGVSTLDQLKKPTSVWIGKIDTAFGDEVLLSHLGLGSTGSNFTCPSFHLTGGNYNTSLQGRVRGDAVVENCPIEAIGAGLECDGEMRIEGCLALTRLNCSVDGNLLVFGGQAPELLPAFACQGSVTFLHCVDRHGEIIPRKVIPPPGQRGVPIIAPSTVTLPKSKDKTQNPCPQRATRSI